MTAFKKLFDYFDRQNFRTIVVNGMQFGDEGKGKLIDGLSEWADIIVRGTGGANAGHTIKVGDKNIVLHLVPSSILWDCEGKLSVIGRGVAVDPRALAWELSSLVVSKLSFDGLRVSHNAHLVLPIDIALDRLRESRTNGKIGTTGRGIGPTYEAHVGRIGLTVNDLLNKDLFVKKLRLNLEARQPELKSFDPIIVANVFDAADLEDGQYYGGCRKGIDVDAIVAHYLTYAEVIRENIIDTDQLLENSRHKRVLLEGAQGVLLSVDHGTYPYVTSSDCSLEGLARGAGISTSRIDYVLGVVKAPYMTRVGNGPFPTEIHGEEAETIRKAGNEFGATTGRPRRIGRLDLPLLRYAVQFGSTTALPKHRATVALTKVDVMNDCDVVLICTHYKFVGDDYHFGNEVLTNGIEIDEVDSGIMDAQVLEHCVPVYKEFPGWKCDLKKTDTKHELPLPLRKIISYIEDQAEIQVVLVSIGADREDTIVF
jgi:adenylosuccinate synthase